MRGHAKVGESGERAERSVGRPGDHSDRMELHAAGVQQLPLRVPNLEVAILAAAGNPIRLVTPADGQDDTLVGSPLEGILRVTVRSTRLFARKLNSTTDRVPWHWC